MYNHVTSSPLPPATGAAAGITAIDYDPLLQFLRAVRAMYQEQDFGRRPGVQRADGRIYYPTIRVVPAC
ncbi:hypothetical protein KTO58_02365 [Chitinophaga pendula]|uniref:hypothetical protein n=1 Tax=Chitinophaga TaxID=79328 RepID=UPI0012FE5D85|nr:MULTISPECIES: hypothetical protein [Chitinophaga]UCJ08043.1 hypothetical protein KTO58_02365 [Chitinophaga pendula]